MFDAFTNKPDFTPFNAVPNQVPLTEAIATPPACGLDTPAAPAATTSAAAPQVPAAMADMAAQWQQWLSKQHTQGNGAKPDFANPEQMNRFTWYDAHNWSTPYPGDSQIFAPDDVPGANIPSSDSD